MMNIGLKIEVLTDDGFCLSLLLLNIMLTYQFLKLIDLEL